MLNDLHAVRDFIGDVRARIDELESLLDRQQRTKPDAGEAALVAPLYGRCAHEGLHRLKNGWSRFDYLREQAEHLIKHLDDALAATRESAPRRSAMQTFRLLNPPGRIPAQAMALTSEERRLEAAIFARYRLLNDLERRNVPGLWQGAAAIQVPLFDRRQRNGWGHIDVVGVGHDLLPVVVELKRADSSDCPLNPVLEGVSYALALQQAQATFRPEYAELLSQFNLQFDEHRDLSPMQIAIMAPEPYWQHWRFPERNHEGWQSFHRLIAALADRHFNVTFWICPDLTESGDLLRQVEAAIGPWCPVSGS